jgi:pimeloyl-ACP methyl ester carboxylesterase
MSYSPKLLLALALVLVISTSNFVSAEEGAFPGGKSKWNGFDMYKDGGRMVIVPAEVAEGKPWVWRARFFGHEPQFDVALLNKGYHLVYCDVGNLYGSPKAVKRWDEFYKYLREDHGFAEKVVLEGMSRGGLIIYNWGIANPEKVAVIYGDAPVMDFKSWPGHANGGILKAYEFKNADEAKAYKGNPVDNLSPLAKAGVPIIHVVGDVDKVVPVSENTGVAEKRYKEMGGVFEVIHKEKTGHHPHSLKDPTPLVDFVLKYTSKKKK